MKRLFLSLVLLSFSHFLISQNCDCLISEVENNSVVPCEYTIGTVVTVSTEAEFSSAVRQVNNSGGNMTILIEDGTYQVASSSGYPYITASNVVFRSLSGNRDAVILKGSGNFDTSPNVENGLFAVGDNITIANLTIKEVGNHGIALTGDNIYVYNVKIQDTYEQMIKGNSTAGGIRNGKVKCSLFEYTSGIGPNWYIGGLDIHQGSNWTVSDNVFKDISSPSLAVAEHAIHFWRASSNNLIERNKIVNCDRGIGFGLGEGASNGNIGGIIKNNMITNNGAKPFHDVGIALEFSPNTEVYNNSIFVAHSSAIEYRFSATTNTKISNNLTNKRIRSRNGGTTTLTTNYTNAEASWFYDKDSGDLRLARNIPEVVDRGTALSAITMDIDQTSRPLSSNHDIGASEFSGTLSTDDKEEQLSKVKIYQSPSSQQITVQSESNFISTVAVHTINGKKVNTFREVNLNNGFLIDTNRWANGVYFFTISNVQNQTKTIKVTVSN